MSDASESRASAGRSRLITDPVASVRGEPVRVHAAPWHNHAEHDVLLPVQFSRVFSRDLRLERERLLMFAVLEDAITSYLTHARARTRRGRETFAEVHDWVSSPDRRRLFAFETICDVLGIDAGSLRRALGERRTRRGRQLRCRPLSTAGPTARSTRPR